MRHALVAPVNGFAVDQRVRWANINLWGSGTVVRVSPPWVWVRWDAYPTFDSKEWGENLAPEKDAK